MKIDQLPGNPGNKQKRKRVGRGEGSGHGKTSGRGHKGAQSRSGYKRKLHYEGGQMPLMRRLPKRGFHNSFRVEYQVVNIKDLDDRFEDGATVNKETLLEARLVRKKREPVKILGTGELTKKLTVEADWFSKSAREKIEAKGGSCVALRAEATTADDGGKESGDGDATSES